MTEARDGSRPADLDERFGAELDRDVWFPFYLPHWSSRAASAATYEVGPNGLRLSIPPDQGLWCAELHPDPMRVSCVQSGSFAGPLGSTIGQQPFQAGLTVREEQPDFWGYTPTYGSLEITMRARIGPRSMFAFWLSGIEDSPEHSGEICVAEIFGDAIRDGVAQVGMGVHRFRDPALGEEFGTEPLRIEVSEDHTYAVDWRPGSVDFSVDRTAVRHLEQAPDYPVQLMIGVFDFPTRHPTPDPSPPEMVVSRVLGRA